VNRGRYERREGGDFICFRCCKILVSKKIIKIMKTTIKRKCTKWYKLTHDFGILVYTKLLFCLHRISFVDRLSASLFLFCFPLLSFWKWA